MLDRILTAPMGPVVLFDLMGHVVLLGPMGFYAQTYYDNTERYEAFYSHHFRYPLKLEAMEAASIITSSSLNCHFTFNLSHPQSSSKTRRFAFPNSVLSSNCLLRVENESVSFRRRAVEASGSVIENVEELVRDTFPKVDKAGRFCSPRSARELALSMVYASCLEGADPVRLFDKRVNAKREPGYEFDKNALLKYNHMSFGGSPVTAETVEEADELLRIDGMESSLEAEVLSAPPKLVYSKLILRFTRKLLSAIVEKWDTHVLVINKVAPANWKNEPAGRILELCILHLAMSEIEVLGTSHRIVINEAVDLAKRFCDGAAPRIINGCLRTYVKEHGDSHAPRMAIESNVEVV